MKQEIQIQWNTLDVIPKENSGWFFVVVKPKNHKCNSLNLEDINHWIEKFGWKIAWYNKHALSPWWETCPFHNALCNGKGELGDRVLYWAEIPSPPLMTIRGMP